ncbi:MAG TPA: hypothetical protein VLS90_21415, partial [Thermodesulfobacteriota bacterium]|nr:hypothetical protein [Thermodesulfobacteriota bacterium]
MQTLSLRFGAENADSLIPAPPRKIYGVLWIMGVGLGIRDDIGMRFLLHLSLICSIVVFPAGFPGVASPADTRPAGLESGDGWSRPVRLKGVPNMYEVAPGLYRGTQPTCEGFEELRKFGIKTVVSLRSFHSVGGEAREHGLDWAQVPMKAWHPEKEDFIRLLRILTDPSRRPALVF